MSTLGAWTEDRIRALREKEDLPFVRADASGIVQEINDRFKAVYGWSEAALIWSIPGFDLAAKLPRFPSRWVCPFPTDGGVQGAESPVETGNVLLRRTRH